MLSAIIPAAIAQRWFSPDVEGEHAADRERYETIKPQPEPVPVGESQ